MMKRLLLATAAVLCLGAGTERLATFEIAGVKTFDALPLEPGRPLAIGRPTTVQRVPESLAGWAFTSAKKGDAVYTITPRSTGVVYIAAERSFASGDDWDAWKDTGIDIGVTRERWQGQFRVYSRNASLGKRFKTPAQGTYVILLIPPQNCGRE